MAQVAQATYQAAVQRLIKPGSGFHFKGATATLAQLETFSIAQMGQTIQEITPNLWNLLGALLDANPSLQHTAPNNSQLDGKDVNTLELEDIAAGLFGNNEGSEESESELDGNELNKGAQNAGENSDPDGSDSDMESEREVSRSNQVDLAEQDDVRDPHHTTQPKKVYQKQNPGKCNAALLYIVSIGYFWCR